MQVSASGVRGAWQCDGLLTKDGLLLERATAERKIELSDEQIRLLEQYLSSFRERHIKARRTGTLVAVNTFFVGVLKDQGRIYLETATDCHSP